MSTAKVISVPITGQQHLLFLFVPLKKGKLAEAVKIADTLHLAAKEVTAPTGPFDPRKTTGVHYFMIYPQADGQKTPGIPVPGFTSFPGKDVLVVMSIYDGQFDAYISAFFAIPAVVNGLNALMYLMDETGIPGVDPNGPTSANHIAKTGVVRNALAFYCLLMRYNFGDPILSAGDSTPGGKYQFGSNFPGLTVANIIDNYPGAADEWPAPPSDVTYTFPKAKKPDCQ